MSVARKHIYNRYFDEVQKKIKAKNPEGVLADFQKLSELVLNRAIAPIHYYYLLNGVDPNEWLSAKEGYKRYKKPEESPLFWLHKFKSESGGTLAHLAMARMEEVEAEIRSRIDKEQEAKSQLIKEMRRAEDEEMASRSIIGTPFDKNWQIKPPGHERV